MASVGVGVEVVARHEGDRARSEDADALEGPAVAQHRGEARIVAQRRHQSAAAGLELGRRGRIASVDTRRGHEVEREGRGAPREFRVRGTESGISHAERIEDPGAQRLARGAPSTISTTRPSTSVETPYSQASPG